VLAREGIIELDHLPESVRCALSAGRPVGAGPASEVTSAAQLTPGAAGNTPAELSPPGELDADDPADDAPLSEDDRRRREQLVGLFREHGGNVSAVARAMGKARMQIQRWMRRYKIDPESFRR
jgi:transcriptional regulator with GAF, ATPase, and Fis domain